MRLCYVITRHARGNMAAAGVVSGKVSNGTGWCGCSWPVACGWWAAAERQASRVGFRGGRRVTAKGLRGLPLRGAGWLCAGFDGPCSQAVQAWALVPGSAPQRGAFPGPLNPFFPPCDSRPSRLPFRLQSLLLFKKKKKSLSLPWLAWLSVVSVVFGGRRRVTMQAS